ncbi:MAG: NAD-dependent DNA ligase LigA, partial [Deltaproteobacteria bacterium]|nr:NAD-dependent DNA ligase LigA [Deltaproteobacteria bacterium]
MPFGSTTQARIRELSTLIHQYNYSYYCANDSDESEKYCADETYDSLVIELKALENQYPEFKLEDSPTLDITDEPHSVFPSRKHLTPMLSLG